jgi:GNAT superfamily N-acetyltransferase
MTAAGHLTHGWEPGLPAGDSLLRRFVLANADRNAFMAECAGGREQRWDDLAIADPASPILFDNAAVLLQPPEYTDLGDAVARTLKFFPPERHFIFVSVWPTADLSRAGLELMGHPPLMFRPPGGPVPVQPPAELVIRRVIDRETLAEFVRTLVEGYPMPGAAGTVLTDPRVLAGPIALFTGYVDGVPVATAGARTGHGIVDVEWVATLPQHRGRGYGAALTWAATTASPEDPALLIASDDGQPVYERLGFVRLQRLTLWHRPPATGTGAR